MDATETLNVTLSSAQGQAVTQGTIQVLTWTQRQRLARAAKALGICWVAAVPAVAVPLMHFILPPFLALVLGPYLFNHFYTQERLILGGQGQCPCCNKAMAIVRSPVKWPLSDICDHCKRTVKIDRSN